MTDRRNNAIILLSVLVMLLLIPSASFSVQPKEQSLFHGPSFNALSLRQQPLTNQSSMIELGYGPSSLVPVIQQIPVYTVNDELWIESNYNTSIQASIFGSVNGRLQTSIIQPLTISDMYSFSSSLVTQNLSLEISVNCPNSCQVLSYPIQFVNPSNNQVSSLVSHYSISNSTLSISLASSDLDNKFDIQQCLSSVASENEVTVPVPSSFGEGFIGIVGNPYTMTAALVLGGSFPAGPFAFSFELLGNYTSALSTQNNSSAIVYTSSELVVAQSNSVLVERGDQPNSTTTLSQLAPLRSGRYILRATFENSNGLQEINTPLFIRSPSASSWFWLGACLELNAISPSFTSEIDLSGSPSTWPRYLYLMYQSPPGIDGYANVSLALSLDRIRFVAGNNNSLPSSIGVSFVRNQPDTSQIADAIVNNGGVVYLITNGTYPVSTTFALTFGGVTFSKSSVVLQSSFSEVLEYVKLAGVKIFATQNGKGLPNATVTIYSSDLNSSIALSTNVNGILQTLVPAGNYLIYVSSGSRTQPPLQESFAAGSSYNLPFIFPGPVDYTSYLVWIVAIITVIGAVGNLWFWLAKRRIRSNLH